MYEVHSKPDGTSHDGPCRALFSVQSDGNLLPKAE
jgi:hypothetical protein